MQRQSFYFGKEKNMVVRTQDGSTGGGTLND